MKFVRNLIIMLVCVLGFLALFAGAYLQESYRLCPPTAAERAEHPILVGFLAGK